MGGEGRGKGRLAIPVLACFRRRCIIETVTSHHQCYGDALFVATTSLLLLLIIIIFIHQMVVDIKRRNKTIINKYLHNQTTQLISPFTNDFFQMLCMLCFLSIVILLETLFFVYRARQRAVENTIHSLATSQNLITHIFLLLTRLPYNLRQTTRECMYFRSCDKDATINIAILIIMWSVFALPSSPCSLRTPRQRASSKAQAYYKVTVSCIQ